MFVENKIFECIMEFSDKITIISILVTIVSWIVTWFEYKGKKTANKRYNTLLISDFADKIHFQYKELSSYSYSELPRKGGGKILKIIEHTNEILADFHKVSPIISKYVDFAEIDNAQKVILSITGYEQLNLYIEKFARIDELLQKILFKINKISSL